MADPIKLETLSLNELADIEAGIKAARSKAVAREVARIEAEAVAAGLSLEAMLGKRMAKRARAGQ